MPSAFLDRNAPPGREELGTSLGPDVTLLWSRIVDGMQERFDRVSGKWSYGGKAYGWSLALKQNKRTILYLIPGKGNLVASFALGEKACATVVADSAIGGSLGAVIADAPRFPEGRAVRLPVETKSDVATVLRLAEIKSAS